jgi:hypothetical protein
VPITQGRLQAHPPCHRLDTLDTCSHAIPAMQQEAAALIAGLVFARR